MTQFETKNLQFIVPRSATGWAVFSVFAVLIALLIIDLSSDLRAHFDKRSWICVDGRIVELDNNNCAGCARIKFVYKFNDYDFFGDRIGPKQFSVIQTTPRTLNHLQSLIENHTPVEVRINTDNLNESFVNLSRHEPILTLIVLIPFLIICGLYVYLFFTLFLKRFFKDR